MTTAEEMLDLLRKFNRGVRNVTIENGVISVFVSSRRAVQGVVTDLLLSRAFASVKAAVEGNSYVIHAVPKG